MIDVSLQYEEVGQLTMTEIGIAFALMRDDRATLRGIASEFSQTFRLSCAADDLVVAQRRMIERSLLEPHGIDPARCLVTERGQQLAYRAFGGLVRFIDADAHVFDVSMIWSLATRRPPNDDE